MILGFACTALMNCEDMNSVNQEYLDRGEGTYIAKIDSVKYGVGLNKVWFKWWLPGDPRIAKTEIRWTEGIETQSRVYALDRSQNDSLIMEVIMNDFPEGSYTFEFINLDSEGNRSVGTEQTVEVIGDRYRANLRKRQPAIATKFGNGYAFVWDESDCLYSDLSYRRASDGKTVTLRLPADNPDSTVVTPRMLLYDYDGSGLFQTTYYLYQTPVFTDTVVVPESPYVFVLDVSGTLTSSETTILGPGNFDLGGEGVGFHDSDSNHDGSGGANYRPNLGDFESAAMDIEGSGGNIGYSNPGEWVQYTVDVAEADYYEIDWYISVNRDGGSACHVEVDGSIVNDIYPLDNNGQWSDWRYYCERNSVVPPYLYLTEGKHTVRFVWDDGGFNFNGLRLKSIDPNRIVSRYSKAGWSIAAFSDQTESDGGGVTMIINDDYGTGKFWHSQWANGNAPLPHWVVIDMVEPKTITKIDTYRRHNTKTVRYYVGNDLVIDLDSWTLIAEGMYGNNDWENNRLLTLEASVSATGRYLMLLLPDSYSEPHIAISEIDVYGY